MTTWNELLQLDGQINQRTFYRKPEIWQEYQRHMQTSDVNANVLNNILKDSTYSLTYNRFPYDLASDENGRQINHLVFWMRPNYKITMEKVKYYVANTLKTRHVVVFENAPRCQTVAEVPHYQVFVRF